MINIIVTGSKGRMGRALVSCAAQHPDLKVVGEVDQGDLLASIIESGQVVVDFSSPNATAEIATLCAERRKALVIGTTGHSDEAQQLLNRLSSQIPIVLSSNFS